MSTPNVSTRLREGGVEAWLVEAVQRLARNEDRSLEPYLLTVREAPKLADTSATCRCHFVRIDPQGNPLLVADAACPDSRAHHARGLGHRLVTTKTLDTHILSLRGKLGESSVITTFRGVGYRLDVP